MELDPRPLEFLQAAMAVITSVTVRPEFDMVLSQLATLHGNLSQMCADSGEDPALTTTGVFYRLVGRTAQAVSRMVDLLPTIQTEASYLHYIDAVAQVATFITEN